MTTECTQSVFGFHPQKRREIRAQFDGGAITSDGGGLLLREVEQRIGILRQFAACFTDYRNPDLIEHTVKELVAQRVYGLALGYEDLNDHEELRNDPLLAVLVEKGDPGSEALAGKSTLNRLELTGETASRKERYKKIVLDHGAVDRLLVDIFLQAHREAPEEIILDLDATDDPLHGQQEGRSSMATMGTTATYRCTSSAESSCCVHGCDHRTSLPQREVSRSCSASWHRFVPHGPRFAWWCEEIRDSAARS